MKEEPFYALRLAMREYYPLYDDTWLAIREISRLDLIRKDSVLYRINQIPQDFAFIYRGLMRAFIIDERGNEYNKIFFDENTFPGSMVALLTQRPSLFEIAALEDCEIIRFDFKAYRKLLNIKEDLKLFHIHYLEKNWLIDKEAREVSLVQKTASERYQLFLKTYPNLEKRVKLFHIASHLGITPTQLSRIRKIKKNQ